MGPSASPPTSTDEEAKLMEIMGEIMQSPVPDFQTTWTGVKARVSMRTLVEMTLGVIQQEWRRGKWRRGRWSWTLTCPHS